MTRGERDLPEEFSGGKLIEVPGTVWDAKQIADISTGVGSLLFDRFPDLSAIERASRLTTFYTTIIDLSNGPLRYALLQTKSGFIGLRFSEIEWEPATQIVYDENDYLYTINSTDGDFDFDKGWIRVRGFTPVTFFETKPGLEIQLFPKNLQAELLENGPEALQDSLATFASFVLETYGDLQTSSSGQEAEAYIRTMLRHIAGEFPRSLLARRVAYPFSFSNSLMCPGTIRVLAEPIERYRKLLTQP